MGAIQFLAYLFRAACQLKNSSFKLLPPLLFSYDPQMFAGLLDASEFYLIQTWLESNLLNQKEPFFIATEFKTL